jgi:two-component system response regulator HydG
MTSGELDRYWNIVVDLIEDGVMIVDRKGIIMSVNKALESISGFNRDEMIGKPCSIFNCDMCEIASDDEKGTLCSLFRAGSLNRLRCTMMRKNGTPIYILKNASVIKDMKGNVIGAVETFTDITEIIKKDIQIETIRKELRSEDRFHGIIGQSPAMQRVFELITNAAQSDAPVIIIGESGTGKELLARAIHDLGPRKRKPFVKVNCAALTETLLESELFGHVKGAFTGAHRNREGRFEAAQGGDIFLDEIGDLPSSSQVKLLRVLEEKVIERVGDNRPIQINVRIITATNKNLKGLVDKGLFRNDLFFRINVIPIALPPLRDREGDIALLAESFFKRIRMESGKEIKGISNETMEVLIRYDWPGNVRELKNAFEYAFVTCQGKLIHPFHLPPNIFHWRDAKTVQTKLSVSQQDMKKKRLAEALKMTGGNRSEAARILGVSRVTVWKQMKRFGIDAKQEMDVYF